MNQQILNNFQQQGTNSNGNNAAQLSPRQPSFTQQSTNAAQGSPANWNQQSATNIRLNLQQNNPMLNAQLSVSCDTFNPLSACLLKSSFMEYFSNNSSNNNKMPLQINDNLVPNDKGHWIHLERLFRGKTASAVRTVFPSHRVLQQPNNNNTTPPSLTSSNWDFSASKAYRKPPNTCQVIYPLACSINFLRQKKML